MPRPPRDSAEWQADVTISADPVHGLLAEQCPSLAVRDLRPFAEGWDNAIWIVNDTVIFRFPRRAVAVSGVEREIRVLPLLADRVPVAIPQPIFVGHPSSAYPWPFFGAHLIEGEEPARLAQPVHGARLGSVFGTCLRALHDPATLAVAGRHLPHDPNARGDIAARILLTRQRLDSLEGLRLWEVPTKVDAILDQAARSPADATRVVTHGDLHVRHVLLDRHGSMRGLIDWGDVCVADCSIDLSLYWSLFDADGRSAFRGAYGRSDLHDPLARARVLALFLNAALAHYAHDVGDAELLRATVSGLERTLIDD